jgi:hypothetical protein
MYIDVDIREIIYEYGERGGKKYAPSWVAGQRRRFSHYAYKNVKYNFFDVLKSVQRT